MELARELPKVSLEDALRLCLLLAEKEPDPFERAAVTWLGRLALELTPRGGPPRSRSSSPSTFHGCGTSAARVGEAVDRR
jgi:hypothetical protein